MPVNSIPDYALLKEQTLAYLKHALCDTLSLPAHQLDEHTAFERYGLDSILVVQLTNTLRETFTNISTTVFFECNTLAELSKHLLKTETAALLKLFGTSEPESKPEPSGGVALQPPHRAHPGLQSRRGRRFSVAPQAADARPREIAIIGLSGQYAQAANLSEFWDNLHAGKNCISEIPPDRWNWQQHPDSYSHWGGFLSEVDKFDPLFFNISPREAETIDPQERLFLQTAYACLEDAGYAPSNLSESRKVGVFVGVMNNNYPGGARHWSIANRVSYHLNFFGPSLAVDTACSSSLTAIYAAMESLRKGDCECALAGGVNLIIDPAHLQRLTAVGMLAHDDRNKAFGAGADGFVDGEGVGALLLKPLERALADGDHIYAILKGGAINAGGKTSGYTVPNPKAQYSLIAQALKDAGVDARSVSYIEAHGTGTALGDPIEIAGLSKAFAEHTSDIQFCAIGSVKSNIGHCESAAGIAGLSKILLQFQHQQLVPSLHAQQPNPEINFSNTPFTVQHTLAAWPKQNSPRRAGISSFGAGGANAHLILEECPEQVAQKVPALPLFVLSAKNTERLQVYAQNFLAFLHTHTPDLNELLYTLQTGREALEERLAFQASSLEDVRGKLQTFLDGREDGIYRGNAKQSKHALAVFAADDDLQQVVDTWIARNKYAKLLDLWVKGLALEWRSLYAGAKPKRISLPTYPFAKERYWLADAPVATRESIRPTPVEVPALLQRLVPQETAALARYVAQTEALNALLWPLLQAQLASVDEAAILPSFAAWLDATRTVFAHAEQSVGTDSVTLWQQWDSNKASEAAVPLQASMMLAEAMLRALPAILTGKTLATTVMFPNSSMVMVENIYKNNALANHFNDILADLVVAYLDLRRQQDPGATVRLFEIGAGTGGTSAVIFQTLSGAEKQQIQEYCYSDLSKAFLNHAEKNYGADNPFLRYQIFNVEQNPQTQGIATGAYDVVIAANVLHATRNLEQTLRNAQALLKPGGLLLLNELSQNNLFLHLTFGLLEGWWRFDDPARRIAGSPAVAPQTWQQVLQDLGFRQVVFPAQALHGFGLQIVVAENALPEASSLVPTLQRGHTSAGAPAPLERRAAHSHRNNGNEEIVHPAWLESHIKDTIAATLSTALKVDADKLDHDDPFSDYGVDSIIGVRFVELLNQALGIELAVTVIFDHSSINRLAKHIVAAHAGAVSVALGQDVLVEADDVDNVQRIKHSVSANVAAPSVDVPLERRGTHSHRHGGNEEEDKPAIAIIGMSGRFPQADDVQELWQHLANGDDLIETVTRWDFSAYLAEDKNFCNSGGFVRNVDKFDPLFFNISGSEANYMDPQQRLFLQEAWNALEDAGYAGARIEGCNCGVYVGGDQTDYSRLFNDSLPAQAFWGNMGSIIPARVSYYLDLQGPAVTIDTACSSSLTAIHLACQALWHREIELALAGGVFITFTPEMYVMANRAGMLSPTGRCHTFDQSADGFVPGEGVCAVILKRLPEALADGDHIYGIIRGIGINQDGATNGITAPSAKSQERLEREVYDRFHINPERITLVEAHGTGTILGDPIECSALNNAFRHYTDKTHYCALGSIKTNIGHTQLAAGIASLIKVLLAMQHQKIPASLHFQQCNTNIQFENSPFYVNTELKDWHTPDGLPRLAALSSFGASGTNAHMVIEEGPRPPARSPVKPGYLITLSARTAEQLQSQATQLLAYAQVHPDTDCGNLSRTLLLGRKHLKHRLACVARNLEDLCAALDKWRQKGKSPQVYTAVLNDKDQREQPVLKHYGNQCIHDTVTAQGGHYLDLLSAVAELYMQGYALDFAGLFQGAGYRMLPLPTYPFAKQRYWVEQDPDVGRIKRSVSATTEPRTLHPLVHENTSDFSEQRFTSRFSGAEFFLADHVVQGKKVLPGVAYLEIASQAAALALGGAAPPVAGRVLKNVVWAQPIVVADVPTTVHIGLVPDSAGDIAYQVYSQPADSAEPMMHSQGVVSFGQPGNALWLDIAAIQAQCAQEILNAPFCYDTFVKIGIAYGPAHQSIETIYVGQNQLLARLSVPACVSQTINDFVLHPSLLDGALQATLGLSIDELRTAGEIRPFLAFALERLEIFRQPPPAVWAFIRLSPGNSPQDKIRKIDMDLCDEQGQVCVQIHKFTSRALGEAGDSIGTLLLKQVWRPEEVAADAQLPDYAEKIVAWIEPKTGWQDRLRGKLTGTELMVLTADGQDLAQRYTRYSIELFERIQIILRAKPKRPVLFQVLVSPTAEDQVFATLVALLKTAHSEYSKFIGQLIEIEADNLEQLPHFLEECARVPNQVHIRYASGKRSVEYLQEIETLPNSVPLRWKNQGVYLLTGGLGGLAQMFAQHIVQHTHNPVLVLSGTSESVPEKQQPALDALRQAGATVIYQTANVAKREDVDRLIARIEQDFGRLDGILHTAGLIHDNFIINKTREEFELVLAPKVAGLINLDEATRHLALDFLVFFASMAGVMSNLGQADYACANAFMDAYAAYREDLVKQGLRQGKTLAIDWPLWASGGMKLAEAVERMMFQNFGIVAMPTDTGMRALQRALALESHQVMVMTGKLAHLRRTLSLETNTVATATTPPTTLPGLPALLETAAQVLQIPVAELDADTEWADLGFDPVQLSALANTLNQAQGSALTPADFLDYSTLNRLAQYFSRSHAPRAATPHGGASAQTPIVAVAVSAPTPVVTAALTPAPAQGAEPASKPAIDSVSALEQVITLLTKNVTKQLQIPPEEIDPEMQLSEFGFDSISLTEFSNNLNQAYKLELTPVLFFEYPTISNFAQYLLDEHPAIFAPKVAPVAPPAAAPPVVAPPVPPPALPTLRSRFQAVPAPMSTPAPVEAAPAVSREDKKPYAHEAVAVIGLSGLFPRAKDAEQFWRNLAAGVECIGEVPKARWNWDGFPKDLWRQDDIDAVRWGGFLDDIECFDPAFFGIASQEAHLMDPQQRLLMMEIWKALEDAGYAKEAAVTDKDANNTGVFIGTIGTDYDKLGETYHIPPGIHSVTGNNPALLSARIANFLNLRGPNLAVATTCSSSLVAIHLACQSLLTGESDLAVAGGCFIMSTAERYLFMVKGGLVSPSGKCHTFDDKADGFVPGESVGVVVLKPFSAAQRDRDHIYAVIKGSGINHDGKTSALSVPNRAAQKALALSVYAKAGVSPADVTCVEAHGTASKLGDHMEFDAMSEAFRQYTDQQQYCAISSVRPNIGHSVSSACISSVIKVLMAFKHKQLPPALNFATPNEYIKFAQSPFFVPTELMAWSPATDGKRRAAINAFALSGTNAHVLLEEFCEAETPPTDLSAPLMFVLSAKTKERLQAYARAQAEFVRDNPATPLANIAFTLHTRRAPMEERLAVFAASAAELAAQWLAYADGQDAAERYTGNVRTGKKLYSLLFEGETGEDFIQLAMQRREMRRLAHLWVNGAKIGWQPLYQDSTARHISLPTYPFAQQRFWVSDVADKTVVAPLPAPEKPAAKPAGVFNLSLPQANVAPPQTAKPGLFNLSLPQTDARPKAAKLDLAGLANLSALPGQTPVQKKTQRELQGILADLLKVSADELDPTTEIGEFGLDSIVVTEYIGRINRLYMLNVMPLALLDSPTLQAFAAYLCQAYPDALAQYYD